MNYEQEMTAVGLEPTTTRLKGACSTTELRGHAGSNALRSLSALLPGFTSTNTVYHALSSLMRGAKQVKRPGNISCIICCSIW